MAFGKMPHDRVEEPVVLSGSLVAKGDIVDLIEHRNNDLDVVRAEVEGLMDRAIEEPRMVADSIRAPIGSGSARLEINPVPIEDLGPAMPPDWVWDGYVAKGYMTLFTGVWKGGKSTLVSWFLHDLQAGGGLVPQPKGTKTLIISEESASAP